HPRPPPPSPTRRSSDLVSADEIVFSAPLEDREACDELLRSLRVEWSMRDDLGKVSLVGAGMKSHPGIAAKTFATLDEIGVESKRSEEHTSELQSLRHLV